MKNVIEIPVISYQEFDYLTDGSGREYSKKISFNIDFVAKIEARKIMDASYTRVTFIDNSYVDTPLKYDEVVMMVNPGK